jgi:hypothetical protein
MTGIYYISLSKETFNCVRKFNGVLIGSKYFDHTGGGGGTHVLQWASASIQRQEGKVWFVSFDRGAFGDYRR